jgi:hypothetical protein
MKKCRLFPLLLLMLAATAAESFAGNWYVHKGATGSNDGTSWTNAWNEMNQINFSAVACGDTIWLAGGTYTTQLSPNKTCTAGNVLTIARVLSTDSVPTHAPGWNSAFDSQVILSNVGIYMAGGAYWTVDGRLGTVSANNFGIASRQAQDGAQGISMPNNANLSHITFHYIELYGPPCVTSQSCTGTNDGYAMRNYYSTVDTMMFDHGWIHRWSEILWSSNDLNSTIQYSQIDTSATTQAEHADILYTTGQTNWTFRYNRVFASDNDGMLYESGGTYNGIYMYGNMYYFNMGQILVYKTGSNFSNVFIYNNVFEWDGSFSAPSGNNWRSFFNWGSTPSSGAVENNVFEGVTAGPWGGVTADYNAYSSDIGKQDSGTHSFTYTKGTQFVSEPDSSNPSAADFNLTSSGVTSFGGKGVSLSAPYNIDMAGNTCSASCNLGVYQAASSANAPAPPSGLTASVH